MLRPTLLALCGAAAVAGCGSSSSPLSKSDLIAKGDAICQRITNGIKTVGATNTAADVVRVAPKVHALEQQGVDDLRKLKPPSSLASDYASFIVKVQVLTDDTTKIGAAAKTNDQRTAQAAAAEATSASAAAAATATKVGFNACSKQN